MSTLATELGAPRAQGLVITDDSLVVNLLDGRTISAPLAWYPRLLHATPEERNRWRLIGNGEGIHWPRLDEDLGVDNLLLGKPSGESQASFKRWLELRKRKKKSTRFYVRAMAAAADSGLEASQRRRKPARRLEKKPD
jgi:uncharacterized protein DUF2442